MTIYNYISLLIYKIKNYFSKKGVKKITEKIITPVQYDIKRDNRFTIYFPEEFDIKSWCVQNFTSPYLYRESENPSSWCWSDMAIEFVQPHTEKVAKKVYDLFFNQRNDFKIKIHFFNSVG